MKLIGANTITPKLIFETYMKLREKNWEANLPNGVLSKWRCENGFGGNLPNKIYEKLCLIKDKKQLLKLYNDLSK